MNPAGRFGFLGTRNRFPNKVRHRPMASQRLLKNISPRFSTKRGTTGWGGGLGGLRGLHSRAVASTAIERMK